MRHAESLYNIAPEKNFKYNPKYADSHLSEKGISQSIKTQDIINTINFEVIYVSPYYRAIETMENVFKTYPNKENVVAYVHPLLVELAGMIHEFIFDIKETKKTFRINNSKIKLDWSLFDEYVNNIKYNENLFFMNNWDLIEEYKRNELYEKFNTLYEKNNFEDYKIEVSKIIEQRYKINKKFESYKHAYERFIEFKKFINQKHKNSFDNKNQKILIISHKTFISIATSDKEYLLKNNKISKDCLVLDNCEIKPFRL